MNKKPALLYFSLFLCIAASAQKSDWHTWHLKGKVRSLTAAMYDPAEEAEAAEKGSQVYKTEFIFNEQGILLETKSYDGQGNYSGGNTCSFDTLGNLAQKSELNADGRTLKRKDYYYNDKGQLAWCHHMEAGKASNNQNTVFLENISLYSYDDKGRVTEVRLTLFDETLVSKDVFTYNEKGQKTVWNQYNADETLHVRHAYKYDVNGYLSEDMQSIPDGKVTSKYTYKNDTKGNRIEEKEYDYTGTLTARRTYKYDEKGNKTAESSYDNSGTLYYTGTFEITYDSAGNWLQRITYADSVVTSIEEQEIGYY